MINKHFFQKSIFHQSFFNISSIKYQPFIYSKKHLLFVNHISIKSNRNINFVNTISTKHQRLFNMKWMLIFPSCPTLNTFCKHHYFINLSSCLSRLMFCVVPSLTKPHFKLKLSWVCLTPSGSWVVICDCRCWRMECCLHSHLHKCRPLGHGATI